MKRIEEAENRLDKLNETVLNLNNCLDEFHNLLDDYKELNEYYGSKEWFKDKENYEKGKIKDIKAGVLSEDAVWNLDEDIRDTVDKMKDIIEKYSTNRVD